MPHLKTAAGVAEPYFSGRVIVAVPNILASARARLARLGDFGRRRAPVLRRIPRVQVLIEWAARIGYGARGFVYLSVGALVLLAAMDVIGDAVGAKGALAWMASRPLGRLWALLIGLGLAAFVMWRILQSVFDADHEGRSWNGLGTRMSQLFSAFSYAALAIAAFGLLAGAPEDITADGVARSRDTASVVLGLPFGKWLLIGGGLAIFSIGVSNIVKAVREDFTEYLACSARLCRRVAPLARIGHVARGLAYLPLAALVVIAGFHAEAAEVTSFGAALGAVERQPAGPWVLALTALGFVAFGSFSLVEARFRRIRPPKDLKPLP